MEPIPHDRTWVKSPDNHNEETKETKEEDW